MEYIKVESSNIDSIGFENDILYVKFKGNTEYKYMNVPVELYESLKKAESKGKFLSESIKGKYNFEKINKKVILNEGSGHTK